MTGCGRPIHVIGTNGGTMACGARLTHLDGEQTTEYCGECCAEENNIILDENNVGSFNGNLASKYAYTTHLRKRLTELWNCDHNRFFAMQGDVLRAAGTERKHAVSYMRPGYVLVEVRK